jgi:ribosomal protein L40E
MAFLWICTVLMACVAALFGFDAQVNAKSAPQQAAGAAIALCLAIIPYIFSRAIEGVVTASWRQKVIDHLAALKKPEPLTSGHPLAAPTVPEAAPVDHKRTGYGYCMNCAAIRSYDAPKCDGCGSTGPVIGDAPVPVASGG